MKPYFDKLRALYKRMSLREKLLSLVFFVVILLLWANHWMGRLSQWNDARQLAAVELETQQQWLDRSDYYTETLNTALQRVDPSKTYADSQLSGRVDSLIRQSGLSTQADIDPVRTREGEIFNDHNLRVRLNRISIAQLIKLNNLLTTETPYINLQSVRIQKNRRNPEQLDVRYEINSFDLKDPNL
ncbi:MAG: hypothetical protein GVY36_09490 [Verrucomicrobia bacterium]|jgi:hypothetical protein|nr:hypothetical protein [Verrucomicrobiota bacterium]